MTPGNLIPAVKNDAGVYEQLPNSPVPADLPPERKNTFLSRLTFTFSIGPDF